MHSSLMIPLDILQLGCLARSITLYTSGMCEYFRNFCLYSSYTHPDTHFSQDLCRRGGQYCSLSAKSSRTVHHSGRQMSVMSSLRFASTSLMSLLSPVLTLAARRTNVLGYEFVSPHIGHLTSLEAFYNNRSLPRVS